MSILLDTDLLSLLERKRIPAKLAAWIAEQNDLVVSVVSLAELEFGLQQAPVAHRQLSCRHAAGICDGDRGVDRADPDSLEGLLADLKKRKRTMTCEDSLIAATVLFRGHSLATHNKRHFEPAGVDVIDPLA